MGVELKAGEANGFQPRRAGVDLRPVPTPSGDEEMIEISEDAYKQNYVYRTWMTGALGERKAR